MTSPRDRHQATWSMHYEHTVSGRAINLNPSPPIILGASLPQVPSRGKAYTLDEPASFGSRAR